MNAYGETLPGACGVEILYEFEDGDNSDFCDGDAINKDFITTGGAGLVCAGFIADDEDSDKMFDKLSNIYDVLFVSPKRLNRNSKNQFYFAVFSVKDVENDKYGYEHSDR